MNVHSLARTTPAGRAVLVRRILEEGWGVTEASESAAVSRRTTYKWLRRFREEGKAGLRDRSSRPRRMPRKTAPDREALVVRLRRCRMVGRQIAARLRMPRSTVARILNRAGISRLSALDPKEPVRRYERKRPGELVHVDVKKLARIRGIGHRITGDRTTRVRGVGWDHVHVCVDDASRLAYVEVLEDEKAATSAGFLRRALAWYRTLAIRVRRVMTDNAFTYQSGAFQDVLKKLRVRHLLTRPYRPQTNGKAERFIQTMLREWAYGRPYTSSALRTRALRPWLRHYNHNRPHGSLGGLPPISRLRPRV